MIESINSFALVPQLIFILIMIGIVTSGAGARRSLKEFAGMAIPPSLRTGTARYVAIGLLIIAIVLPSPPVDALIVPLLSLFVVFSGIAKGEK